MCDRNIHIGTLLIEVKWQQTWKKSPWSYFSPDNIKYTTLKNLNYVLQLKITQIQTMILGYSTTKYSETLSSVSSISESVHIWKMILHGWFFKLGKISHTVQRKCPSSRGCPLIECTFWRQFLLWQKNSNLSTLFLIGWWCAWCPLGWPWHCLR